ncbi:hypothetical protein [Sphingomicrobium nitratireducens]|uniref:hypothetical protein n=1 Tax=Sphingomicrobium nitratireducens TaxID=2964666 RepID=UPI00223F0D87|nr:hypothetical protein [Sphingomicrobium nitratireducens]
MSNDKKTPTNAETPNEEAPALLNEDKIDALDTETFDAVKYQEQGQGGPDKGLKADLED